MTKIYSYGASEPATNLESVCQQMRDAHRFRNWHVELELERRKIVDELLADVDPRILDVNAEIARLDGEIGALRLGVSAGNARRRRRECSADDELRIDVLVDQRKALYDDRKALRSRVFRSMEWRPRQREVDAWFAVEEKARRAAAKHLIEWGTRGFVEQSIKGTRYKMPPRFRPWEDDGHLAVQVQGGLSPAEVLDCADTRVRVSERPDGVWVPGTRRPKKLGDAVLSMRIGSSGRAPIFAEVPFYLHRPLPDGSKIKWVHLIRRRIGLCDRWLVQFTIDDVKVEASTGTGEVSIDVGWRVMEDRGLRVAVWRGSDGRTGELSLPATRRLANGQPVQWIDGYREAEKIRALRDEKFNEARLALVGWLRPGVAPSWLLERAETLPQWHAPERLVRFADEWRRRRFAEPSERLGISDDAGDSAFGALWAWRRKEKHLHAYEDERRDRLQAQRLDTYRAFAAFLGRNYAAVRFEKMDLRDFHKRPEPEDVREESENRKRKKEHVRDAALSILRRCIGEKLPVIKVKAAYTTRDCSSCGHENEWEDQSSLVLKCENCGATWDQDKNARVNLASASVI